eukprot:80895-Lingulodinium_polyedra.AAC.1
MFGRPSRARHPKVRPPRASDVLGDRARANAAPSTMAVVAATPGLHVDGGGWPVMYWHGWRLGL